jgi:hypothetical protein
MSTTINIEPSSMQIRFRVMRFLSGDSIMLASFEQYDSAEEFCWKYKGPGELQINRIWIQKGTH